MGMRIDVEFTGDPPPFGQLAETLFPRIGAVSVRMIDNLPAFPDEIPEPGWVELRLATANGMISLRRIANGISCTVWGNADAKLVADQRAIADAIASLSNGKVGAVGDAHSASPTQRSE